MQRYILYLTKISIIAFMNIVFGSKILRGDCTLTINTNDLKRHRGLWPIDVVGLIFF